MRTTSSIVWSAASISSSELQAREKTVWCAALLLKSSKAKKNTLFSYRKVTRRQRKRHLTCNGTYHCQNGSSSILTQFREQPRLNRIVVAYPRPAFSATKRTNHAPISFDQQARVSQGHMSCKMRENRNTEVRGGGGLELMKLAREPSSSHPKTCTSLKTHPRVLHVHRFLLALVGRKQTVVRDQFFPLKPSGSRR